MGIEKIEAIRHNGELWIRLDDHKKDIERYKMKIEQLTKSVPASNAFDTLFGDILGKKK